MLYYVYSFGKSALSSVIITWVVVGLLAAIDVAYIVLVALDKISVKERKEPEEEY